MRTQYLPAGIAILALPFTLPAQTVGFIEHSVPTTFGTDPSAITLGPDNALWFTDSSTDGSGTAYIGQMARDGRVTAYPVPTRNSQPIGITVGPDGALWFTEYTAAKIGRITTAGVITEYPTTAGSSPFNITAGPDGALWYTELPNSIGRMTTEGAVTDYAIPGLSQDDWPDGITVGPDGAIWFTEAPGSIGRITTDGVMSEYSTPFFNANPTSITTGADGNLWFTEYSPGRIGRITTSGVMTEFTIPSNESLPFSITAGPLDSLWFTDFGGRKIGKITTAGRITEFAVPWGSPDFITAVPTSALWFTESNGEVAQLVSESAAVSTDPDTGSLGLPISVTGTGFASGETVNIYNNSEAANLLETVQADSSGSFVVDDHIRQLPFGFNSWVGVGQTSQSVGIAQVSITARVTVEPAVVAAGAQITVRGFGFNQADTVDVYLGTQANGDLLTQVRASQLGTIAPVLYTVPAGTPPGQYEIDAVGAFGYPGVAFAIATYTVQ